MSEDMVVLHVDDQSDFLDISASFLERENEEIRVETETSAREGLDRLERADVDCVVSDYQMPKMDGLEFLEAVREQYPDLPFILFTGKGSEEVAGEAISAGATDYIQKSTGTDQYTVLANRIKNVVERYRARRRSERAKRRQRRMLRRITDGFTKMDETLTITDLNQQTVEFADQPRNEIIGKNYQNLKEDESGEQFIEAYETALETGDAQRVVGRSDLSPDRWVEERIFPEDNGDGLFIYFRDITARKRHEEIQRIIVDISTELIDADQTEIDEGIEETLRRIGEFEQAKRSYLFQLGEPEHVMDNTHEWSAPGVEPQKPELREVDTQPFSWFLPKIRNGEVVTVPDVDELPAEANRLREALEAGNVSSLVAVPIIRSGDPFGFIGFDWDSTKSPWSEETVDLLRISGNMIGNALVRKRSLSNQPVSG